MPKEPKKYNYMNICRGSKRNHVVISVKDDFFHYKDDIIVKILDEKMILSKPSIDYLGKTQKMSKGNSGWLVFSTSQPLPLGKFFFDEEDTNEDMVVVYFNQQQ